MKQDLENYIAELEEKIIELSLKLKKTSNELNSIEQSNKKTISTLIHNLKNPIGNIFSFSDIILESLNDYSPEKLEKYLTIINNSARYSIQLLNSLALFNEIKLANFENKKANYIEIINNVISNFKELALKKNITFEKNIATSALYLTINTDKISLALGNIISNALRFSNENTKITIEVKENSDSVETIISDEGIGISEANLFSVFNVFQVVNTYSNDKQKCIGLGLPIAKNIIEYYGGEISIKSTINKGSQVKITLPIH
tara:strand:- start:1064 stop:1843 length:780 start_codon:yes stop_codon:yes gene_type:complete